MSGVRGTEHGRLPCPSGLTTLGLNGGWISLFSSFSQSILLKKACSLTSLSPSGPQPSRLAGCLVISWSEEETKAQMSDRIFPGQLCLPIDGGAA